MSIENTAQDNSKVVVPLGDDSKAISPELFKQYKEEAFEYLQEETKAKRLFKEVVETTSEVTGLPKATVSKYFKARFKDETKVPRELAATFEALDEAVDGAYVADSGED